MIKWKAWKENAKRGLVLLLTTAMVVTSDFVPVFAATSSENDVNQQETISENISEDTEEEQGESEAVVEEDISEDVSAEVVEATSVSDSEVSVNQTAEELTGAQGTNGIAKPTKVKATLNKKNQITISWKKSKGTKYVEIYRMNADKTFDTRTAFSTNKTKVLDTEADTKDTYVYKIVPYGTDEMGVWGAGEPAYAVCTPIITSVQRRDDSDTDITTYRMNIKFTTVKGIENYTIDHAYKTKKNYQQVEVVSNLNGAGVETYYGNLVTSLNGKAIAQENYIDGDNLTFGAKYYYRVRASVNIDGTDIYSEYSKPVVGKVTERAPKVISANDISGTKASITFEDMDELSGTDSYRIYVATAGTEKYKKYKDVSVSSFTSSMKSTTMLDGKSIDCVTYTCTNLKPETDYSFKIAAIKQKVLGAQSDRLMTRTKLTDLTGMTATTKTYNAVTLSWNAVDGAQGYHLYYTQPLTEAQTSNPSTWTFEEKFIKVSKSSKKGVVTYIKSGLKNAKYYGFYAVPYYGKNEHAQDTAAISVWAKTKIAAPTVSAVSASPTEIKVSWKKVPGATGYYVQYYQDSIQGKPTAYNTGTATSFVIDGLQTGEPVYICVASRCDKDGATGEDQYGDDSPIVKGQAKPNAPTKLKTSYQDDGEGAKLTWTEGKGATGYRIERSYEQKKNYVVLEEYTTSESYKDTTALKDGKLAYYRVYSVYHNAKKPEWNVDGDGYDLERYCMPSSISVSDKSVGKGNTIGVSVSFSKNTTMKDIVNWTASGGDTGEDGKSKNDYIQITWDHDNYASTAKIKGLKAGKTKVTVKSRNDKTCTFTVTVTGTVIVLDPGHGGSDSGASSGGLVEKTMTLKTAVYTKEYLEDAGFTVYMTRTSDTYVGLENRVTMYKDNNIKVIVSQHFNSASGASGVESYYSISGAGSSLAAKMCSYTASAMGITNRGAKTKNSTEYPGEDYYAINRYATRNRITSIIMENGFIQNDASKMNSDSDLQKIAQANAQAIIDYYN